MEVARSTGNNAGAHVTSSANTCPASVAIHVKSSYPMSKAGSHADTSRSSNPLAWSHTSTLHCAPPTLPLCFPLVLPLSVLA